MDEKLFSSVTIIGGGAWGTAMAHICATAGLDSLLWARNKKVVQAINEGNNNPHYLPNIRLDARLRATDDLSQIAFADMLLLAVPAQQTRDICVRLADIIDRATPLVLLAKGVELESGLLLNACVQEVLPGQCVAVLSGPGFAKEVACGLPTAVTIASQNIKLAENLCAALASGSFRPYASDDMVGVQIGGALKNVLAIACGIVAGRGLGASAQAALAARGMAEFSRLGEKMGAQRQTLMGLSGLGDVMLCCANEGSRNFAFGYALGRGTKPDGGLAEGVFTAQVILKLARKYAIDLPVMSGVCAAVRDEISVDDVVLSLMQRPLRRE